MAVALPEAPGESSSVAAGAPAAGATTADAAGATGRSGEGFDLAAGGQPHGAARTEMAGPYDKYIAPDEKAPPLTSQDKAGLGFRAAFSPLGVVGIILSAGYEHVLNGSPNYGTDRGAFGQRLGASGIRSTSEGIFTDVIMSNVLREDPRYYQLGHGHPFVRRIVYAGTRVLVTRSDGGRTVPNLALLSGYAGAAALTNTYYPQSNRGFSQTAETYGGSLGGAAIGFLTSEFLGDTLQFLHLQKDK